MRTEIKVQWGDSIALRNGSIGLVAEQDPDTFVIRAVFKDRQSGAVVTRYVRTEDVEQVMAKQ
jgi:hypothetical protein